MPQSNAIGSIVSRALTFAATAFKSAPAVASADGALLTGKGLKSVLNMPATTNTKLGASGVGRICKIYVNTAGTTTGSVYDSATTGGTSAANLIAVIPNTVGIYDIDCPVGNGIVVATGTGQVVSATYQQ